MSNFKLRLLHGIASCVQEALLPSGQLRRASFVRKQQIQQKGGSTLRTSGVGVSAHREVRGEEVEGRHRVGGRHK